MRRRVELVLTLNENVILNDDFNKWFKQLIDQVKIGDYDIVLFDKYEDDGTDDLHIIYKKQTINLELSNGYLISKNGINRILNHIQTNRIKN